MIMRAALAAVCLVVAGVARADEAFVTNQSSDDLSVLDLATGQPVATIPIGGRPAGVSVTADGSRAYVTSPDGKTLLSADRDSNEVSVVDVATQKRVARIKVGDRPFGVTIDAKGERAYSANVATNDISVIDIAQRKVIGVVQVGERPYAVALAGGKAFVTNQYANNVSVIDLATLKKLADITVGDYPEGIEASSDGKSVYVSNWFANTLSQIDVETLKVVKEIPTGDGPRAFGLFIRKLP